MPMPWSPTEQKTCAPLCHAWIATFELGHSLGDSAGGTGVDRDAGGLQGVEGLRAAVAGDHGPDAPVADQLGGLDAGQAHDGQGVALGQVAGQQPLAQLGGQPDQRPGARYSLRRRFLRHIDHAGPALLVDVT